MYERAWTDNEEGGAIKVGSGLAYSEEEEEEKKSEEEEVATEEVEAEEDDVDFDEEYGFDDKRDAWKNPSPWETFTSAVFLSTNGKSREGEEVGVRDGVSGGVV